MTSQINKNKTIVETRVKSKISTRVILPPKIKVPEYYTTAVG
ncbi:MAG: hypothetical protein ACD_61C00106G0002 [uncultured bacterium]|nr:MAG: hypothetical protein ACD_61C00106G0002 [uncultured bacterium]